MHYDDYFISDDRGPCHVHDKMRLKKPYLKDSLPTKTCLLCDRAFCVDHKGKEEDVCEINHDTYYRNHPAAQNWLYRTYADYERDYKEMQEAEMSGDEREAVLRQKEKGGKAELGPAVEDGAEAGPAKGDGKPMDGDQK